MSVVRQPQVKFGGGAVGAPNQKALRMKRQSAPSANFLHNTNPSAVASKVGLDKENAHAMTPSKTKSIIKKPESEAKKQKAMKKRRVSFSSQLENVRFFDKEQGGAQSPNKAAQKQRQQAFDAQAVASAIDSSSNIGTHDTMDDDFEREKDLLEDIAPVEKASTSQSNKSAQQESVVSGPFNLTSASQKAPMTKRRLSVGFAEPQHDVVQGRRSSLPNAPLETAAPNQVEADLPSNLIDFSVAGNDTIHSSTNASMAVTETMAPEASSSRVVAPTPHAWEQEFGFIYGSSDIDQLAPLSSFEGTSRGADNEQSNASRPLINFHDDRRMSVSSLASPGVLRPFSRTTTPATTPSHTSNPVSMSQLLFGTPGAAQAPAATNNRRESLMEFTNIGGSNIQGPAVDQSQAASMTLDETNDTNDNEGNAADSTGSFGAVLKSRGIKRMRRDSLGSIMRRGVDWDALEEGFESRPAAELSARIEADAIAAATPGLDFDDLMDASRPSKRRMSSAMDLTGVAGGIIGLAGNTARLSLGGAPTGSRSRRTSDVMDLTSMATSNILLGNHTATVAPGNTSLSDEDPSNMTLNLTQTFTGLRNATRRFSLEGDPDAMMDHTAAVGGIIGLAGENTTRKASRLSLPVEFAGENTRQLNLDMDMTGVVGSSLIDAPSDSFRGEDDKAEDDGMDMTMVGTSRISLGGLDQTRRQSIGMDMTSMGGRISLGGMDTRRDSLLGGSSRRGSIMPNEKDDDGMDMEMATANHGAIALGIPASPAPQNWSIGNSSSDDSNNDTMGTETIEARVNMEANKHITLSPPADSFSDLEQTDRRKSVGMELTGAYGGSILADNTASFVGQTMDATIQEPAQVEIIEPEAEPEPEQAAVPAPEPAPVEQEPAQSVEQKVQPIETSLQHESMEIDDAHELGATAESTDGGLLMNMSLRDELAAIQGDVNNTTTGNTERVLQLSPQQAAGYDQSRRESVATLMRSLTLGDYTEMKTNNVGIEEEQQQTPQQQAEEYEMVTPNETLTMRTRQIAEFPLQTPAPASFTSLRSALQSEPISLERFLFLTNMRFAGHRRSSIAPQMQTAIEPRSDNAKIHSFFVSRPLGATQEELCGQLMDNITATRERIQALEQKLRSAALNNEVPIFRMLQQAQSEREVQKIAHELAKFKNAIKHDVKKKLNESLLGKPVEEAKLAALAEVRDKLQKDAALLEGLSAQQTTDMEVLRLEKDNAVFRRYNQNQQKSRRAVSHVEVAKSRAEAAAEAEDNAAIIVGASGWKPVRMDSNKVSFKFKNTVSVEIGIAQNGTAPTVSHFSVQPICESGLKRQLLESVIPQLQLLQSFAPVKSQDELRDAARLMATRLGRAEDLVKEIMNINGYFVCNIKPGTSEIIVSSTFSSSLALNRFTVEMSLSSAASYPFGNDCVSLRSFENDFGSVEHGDVLAVIREQLELGMPAPLTRIFRALDKLAAESK